MISDIVAISFFSTFAISILLCYRAGKIVNLSLSSISTLGAYFYFNPLIAAFLGSFTGFLLHEITKKLETSRATIFSLGMAIAIEETIRISFRREYTVIPIQTVELLGEVIPLSHLFALSISFAFLLSFTFLLFSRISRVLRIVEEDYELAEIYGVRTRRVRMIILSSTGGLVALLSSFYNQGILYPTMGWQNLTFAVIIATFANIFGEKSYMLAILFTAVIACLPKLLL